MYALPVCVYMCVYKHIYTCTHSRSTKTLHSIPLSSQCFLRKEENLTAMFSYLFLDAQAFWAQADKE